MRCSVEDLNCASSIDAGRGVCVRSDTSVISTDRSRLMFAVGTSWVGGRVCGARIGGGRSLGARSPSSTSIPMVRRQSIVCDIRGSSSDRFKRVRRRVIFGGSSPAKVSMGFVFAAATRLRPIRRTELSNSFCARLGPCSESSSSSESVKHELISRNSARMRAFFILWHEINQVSIADSRKGPTY
jgi:hypothetical protein